MEIRLLTSTEEQDGYLAFARGMKDIQKLIPFKVSARGWCYQLEGYGLITKAQFDKAEGVINTCRDEGYLPIDFTADEEARQFSGVETPDSISPLQFLQRSLVAPLQCENWYMPDWWDGEECYIQMLVEKIDLKTIFEPVCEEYHIPIATSKGWSSKLQRAKYTRRFKKAEEAGLRCVLLYCGDHDPDGLRISGFLRSNLKRLEKICWEDGETGYDPADLDIKRFGLNYDFIIANNLTWIDNLITAAKEPCRICGKPKSLADPHHRNHRLPYVQNYLRDIGERKCEANALVVRPAEARALVRGVIESYVGAGALGRFAEKRNAIKEEIAEFRERTHLEATISKALRLIDEEE